jgi:hypothetical protein
MSLAPHKSVSFLESNDSSARPYSSEVRSGQVVLNDNEDIHKTAKFEKDISRAYSSSYINYLLDHDPDVCAIMLESKDTLPLYGTCPSIGIWIHIDTGATCAVTNQRGELHCPAPSLEICGTAQHSAKVPILAVGTLVFDLIGRYKSLLPTEALGTCDITAFGRRSLKSTCSEEPEILLWS